MRNVRTAVLAGAAALLVAGTAVAASKNTRTLTVGLPDGSVAHVEYVGDVAPKVTVEPLRGHIPIVMFDTFDAAPIAMLERVSAAMDGQVETMMRHVQALASQSPANNGKPDFAAFRGVPGQFSSYTMVSTSNGDHSCFRSWKATSQGLNESPKVIATSAGDCGGVAEGAKPTEATTVSAVRPAQKTATPAKPIIS